MLVPDVNVLVDAWREHSSAHARASNWLERAAAASELGLPDVIVSGAVRVLTMPVAGLCADVSVVLDRVRDLRAAPGVRRVTPGPGHWAIFDALCRELGASGNTVPNCYIAALAIEKKATFVSRDRFFASVPGLDWTDLPDTA
ncbi:MAG: TA system VapC family ribonuclease toxin [Aeromicrobium sp.]